MNLWGAFLAGMVAGYLASAVMGFILWVCDDDGDADPERER